MECMEARALKSSHFSEAAMKPTNQQGFSDEFLCVTALPNEDFSIDEFFNLPKEEKIDGFFFEEEDDEEEEEEKDSSSLSPSFRDPIDDIPSNSLNFSTDLAIPADDLQELELWSHFMDDSVPEATLACPKPTNIDTQFKKSRFCVENRVEPGRKRRNAGVLFIPSAVPVKPRTKRHRTSENRAWKADSSSSSSSSSSPVSTLLFPQVSVSEMRAVFTVRKPALKKPKRKPASSGESSVGSVQRRCSHCQVTKTPQWRAGPNGPKTLCNACGVRFKSGRLFPEYRPACSPTFSSEVHSNSHRKVLEMRRKKELTESSTGSTPSVDSVSVSMNASIIS